MKSIDTIFNLGNFGKGISVALIDVYLIIRWWRSLCILYYSIADQLESYSFNVEFGVFALFQDGDGGFRIGTFQRILEFAMLCACLSSVSVLPVL